ncbi:uncharacterized protein H6S33_004475 [Morchella sextelata]|uniref:uncharacterized protein n=1 Tax=Morchella sextelata TaxID=1174677 RepID=UPI001D04920D|nr:uncharacterized protein H6S33_004475 [Morchella sextelata]KAH0606018.1 hypothetical protein H6S33_004475 [Morchella sextelata]
MKLLTTKPFADVPPPGNRLLTPALKPLQRRLRAWSRRPAPALVLVWMRRLVPWL